MKKYMLDTNIFNHFLDQHYDLEELTEKGVFFVTHIQQDEINKTPNEFRRNNLIKIFKGIICGDILKASKALRGSKLVNARKNGTTIPTETVIWDVSKWDQGNWGDEENGIYEPIKKKLDELNNNKKNNIQDALIAETSILNGLVLITDDNDLLTVTKMFNGKSSKSSTIFGKSFHTKKE